MIFKLCLKLKNKHTHVIKLAVKITFKCLTLKCGSIKYNFYLFNFNMFNFLSQKQTNMAHDNQRLCQHGQGLHRIQLPQHSFCFFPEWTCGKNLKDINVCF